MLLEERQRLAEILYRQHGRLGDAKGLHVLDLPGNQDNEGRFSSIDERPDDRDRQRAAAGDDGDAAVAARLCLRLVSPVHHPRHRRRRAAARQSGACRAA